MKLKYSGVSPTLLFFYLDCNLVLIEDSVQHQVCQFYMQGEELCHCSLSLIFVNITSGIVNKHFNNFMADNLIIIKPNKSPPGAGIVQRGPFYHILFT